MTLAGDLVRVPVELGVRSYDVWVGRGARHRLADVLPPSARRVAIVTQASVAQLVALEVGDEREPRQFIMGDGEDAKSIASVEGLCRQFSQWGLSRRDVVVSLGGGVVTDTAGFTAAVYHRGVPVVHVPTTLVAQIDAAIGGKTGVNLPEGKNLVGAYWQPSAVLCDTETLETLPRREYRSGLGELAKYHFLADEGWNDLQPADLDTCVARCVALKARVVAADERESAAGAGPGQLSRATLNYGHTLAHAIETVVGYDVRHGEAVAIGLVFAAELAHRLGRIDAARVREHRRVIAGYDLPMTLPSGISPTELIETMGRDKKLLSDWGRSAGGDTGADPGLTFVLDGPKGVELVTGVKPSDAASVLAELVG